MTPDRNLSFSRVFKKLLASIALSTLVPSRVRVLLHKLRGVRFDDHQTVFIGPGVYLDGILPQNIRIGKGVIITSGVHILTHYISTKELSKDTGEHFNFVSGEVIIGDYVFIGLNTVIARPVAIKSNVIIGANSVVTKDFGNDLIIGGNPAQIIRTIGSH